MIRRPPRSTLSSSSAASDVYKRQNLLRSGRHPSREIEPLRSLSNWSTYHLLTLFQRIPMLRSVGLLISAVDLISAGCRFGWVLLQNLHDRLLSSVVALPPKVYADQRQNEEPAVDPRGRVAVRRGIRHVVVHLLEGALLPLLAVVPQHVRVRALLPSDDHQQQHSEERSDRAAVSGDLKHRHCR
eukprot:TRINITY_DN1559_c0_g1_i7.p1 TRINITY_DN1559_c0_g1~~TRINITY_DN1559_c0_g1_i7.p1  ORF type:complete len:185 (+),score=11.55 TRINITY_DN1559_c0_g1_i7:125-679(+)